MDCRLCGHTESDTTEPLYFHFSLSCIEEGNGNPLQCSCLGNPRDGRAWWAAICGVAQSWTRLKWLSSSSNNQLKKYIAPFSKTSKEGTLRPPSDFYVRIFLCPFLYFDKTLLHKSSWVIKPGPWSQSCIFFGDHKSNIVHCRLSPGGASGKESTCQCRRQKRREFSLWVGKIPWRGARQLTPVFSPGKLHGQRSLAGCCPWGCKELDAIVVT